MSAPVRLDSEAFYDVDLLHFGLGLSRTAVERAASAGKLRSSRSCGKLLFKGEWVSAWLSGEPALAGGAAA